MLKDILLLFLWLTSTETFSPLVGSEHCSDSDRGDAAAALAQLLETQKREKCLFNIVRSPNRAVYKIVLYKLI